MGNNIKFREANEQDIEQIMAIISQAQQYFKNKKIDQWQNQYPNIKSIEIDIENNHSYVFEKDGKIIATAAVSFDGEKTYEHIYDGEWLSEEYYAVVHRLAVDQDYKGLGISSIVMNYIEEMCIHCDIYSIKIDTHEENLPMQRLLEKNHFTYCGVILLENGHKRVAFEKILK